MSKRAIAIIPCFNEEHRLDIDRFATFFSDAELKLLFVDDGSRDRTAQVIQKFCKLHPKSAKRLRLDRNQGKAEAIRQGMRKALKENPTYLGFMDADLSTPPEEFMRLLKQARKGDHEVVMGARIKMLGTDIDRSGSRHILGRVFATVVSLALGIDVYDTQCGAKIFRNSPVFSAAMKSPFLTRWAFDVELLARLLYPENDALEPIRVEEILEVPLKSWLDVKGSKLGPLEMGRALGETIRVAVMVQRIKRR